MATQPQPLLTPEQVRKAWQDQAYFKTLTPQQQAFAMKGGVQNQNTPQGVANAQAAAGVPPAIAPDAGDGAEGRYLGKLSLKPPKANVDGGVAYRYPFEAPIGPDSDYVVFEFWEYNPPFGRDETGDAGNNTTSTGTASYKTYNASIDDLKSAKDLNRPNESLNPIILYMPEDVQTQYGQKWGGAAFGSVTAGLLQTMGTTADGEVAENNFAGVVKSKVFDALRQGINKVAGASVSENQALGGITGTILNPNTEMMYDGPELRTLELTFKMVATSKREAEEIKKICTTFKKAMLPKFGGRATSFFGGIKPQGNLLTIPNICTVKYMKGANFHPYLPQYKAMAISNIAINYTPDGSYATYDDGSPVATQLKISLKEMKNIFASEINDQGGSY